MVLSEKSLKRLEGVDARLVRVVKRAIVLTGVDFAVTEGLRSPERQKALYLAGKSKVEEGGTHVSGRAVDVAALINGSANWEIENYIKIADAFRVAAIDEGVGLRWGGAWFCPDIRKSGSAAIAYSATLGVYQARKQRPFIDGPHFELAKAEM
jgi:peptidoglycan L-alanyl-D-glutamate endopeptidase CwlK